MKARPISYAERITASRARYAKLRPPPSPEPIPLPPPLIQLEILSEKLADSKRTWFIAARDTQSPTQHLLVMRQAGESNFLPFPHKCEAFIIPPTAKTVQEVLDFTPPTFTIFTKPFPFFDKEALHAEAKRIIKTQIEN